MSETPCSYRYPRSGGGATYPCLSYADAEDGRCAAHRDWQARAARLEVDLRAAREEAAGLRRAINDALYDYDHRDELSAIDTLRAALAAAAPEPSSGGE